MKPTTRFVIWSVLVLGAAVAGITCGGVAHRHQSVASSARWRARGHGRILVEFFDPGCVYSRRMHAELDRLFRDSREGFLQVTVPVALADVRRSPDPTYDLCGLDEATCTRQIASNTRFLEGALGATTTPVVWFEGELYRGLGALGSIEVDLVETE